MDACSVVGSEASPARSGTQKSGKFSRFVGMNMPNQASLYVPKVKYAGRLLSLLQSRLAAGLVAFTFPA
jgi:hypothetical protein